MNPCLSKHFADSRGADLVVAEVLHDALDASISPPCVLGGDLDDQGVPLCPAFLGGREIAILWGEFHGHELPMPRVDRLRRDKVRKLHQELTTELAARVG